MRPVALALMVLTLAASGAAAQRRGPDPVAMAILCTIERGWANASDALARMGCSPDSSAIPPGRRPCELRAPNVDPRALSYDARGRLREVRSTFRVPTGTLPLVETYENDDRGIVTAPAFGSPGEVTTFRREGSVIVQSGRGELLDLESRFVLDADGVGSIERAQLERNATHDRHVVSRWELAVHGRIRTATHVLGSSWGTDTSELEWDARGRPIRLHSVTGSGSRGEAFEEERTFTWNARGQLVAMTPDPHHVEPTEIVYDCAAQ
jgi:hypothetical protein